MKKILLLSCVLLSVCFVKAQTVERYVISSTGFSYAGPSLQVDYTAGEIMVATVFSPDNILTQGFQQPEDLAVSVPETPVLSGDIVIYPNPTNGQFTLTYNSYSSEENAIKLYNLVGQVVLTTPVLQSSGSNTVTFDISSFSQGLYMLEITTVDAKGVKQTSYNKINLVY